MLTTELAKIYLDPNNQMKANAGFLGLLAYPESKEEAFKFARALISVLYREKAKADPQWAWQVQNIQPAYLIKNPETAYRSFTAGTKKIDARNQAAEIAIPILMDETGGDLFNVTVLGEHPDITKMARVVDAVVRKLEDITDGESSNITHRAWSPTKPVIHMALAYRSMRYEMNPTTEAHSLPDEIGMLEFDWIERATTGAHMFRKLIQNSKSQSFDKKGFATFDFELCYENGSVVPSSKPKQPSFKE